MSESTSSGTPLRATMAVGGVLLLWAAYTTLQTPSCWGPSARGGRRFSASFRAFWGWASCGQPADLARTATGALLSSLPAPGSGNGPGGAQEVGTDSPFGAVRAVAHWAAVCRGADLGGGGGDGCPLSFRASVGVAGAARSDRRVGDGPAQSDLGDWTPVSAAGLTLHHR